MNQQSEGLERRREDDLSKGILLSKSYNKSQTFALLIFTKNSKLNQHHLPH